MKLQEAIVVAVITAVVAAIVSYLINKNQTEEIINRLK